MSRGQLRNVDMFNGNSTGCTGEFQDIFGAHYSEIYSEAADVEGRSASVRSSPESIIGSSSITLDFTANEIANGHVMAEPTTRETGHVKETGNNSSSVLMGNPPKKTQRVDMRVSGNLNATIAKLQQLQLGRQVEDNVFQKDEDLPEVTQNDPRISENTFPSENRLDLTLSILNHSNSLALHTNMKQSDGQGLQSDLPSIGITCSSPTQWTIQEDRSASFSPASLSPMSLTPAPSLSGSSSPSDLRLTPSSRSLSDSPLPPLKGTPKMGRKTLPPIRSNSVSPVNLPTPPKHSKLGNRALVPPIEFKSSFEVNFSQEDARHKEVSPSTAAPVCSYLEQCPEPYDKSFRDHPEIPLTACQEQHIPLRSRSNNLSDVHSSQWAENEMSGSHRFTCNHDERYSEFDAVAADQDTRMDEKTEIRLEYSGNYRDSDRSPGNSEVHFKTVADNEDSHFNIRTHFTENYDQREFTFENSRTERNPRTSKSTDKKVRRFSNMSEDRRSFHDRNRSQRMSLGQHESEIQLSVHNSQFHGEQKTIVSKGGDLIDCYLEFPASHMGDRLTFPFDSRRAHFPPDGPCGHRRAHNLRNQTDPLYSVEVPYCLQSPSRPKHMYRSQRALSQDDHDTMEIHAHFHRESNQPHPHAFPDHRRNELSFRRDPCTKCVPAEMAHDPVLIRCQRPSQSDFSRKVSHSKGTRHRRNSKSIPDTDNVHIDGAPPVIRNRERATFSLPTQRMSEVGFNDNAKTESRSVKLPANAPCRSSSLCRPRRFSVQLTDQRLDTKCDVSRERRPRGILTRALSFNSPPSSLKDILVTPMTPDRSIGGAERRGRKSGIADGDFLDKQRPTQGRVLLPCIRRSRHSLENSATNADGQTRRFLIRRKNVSS